MMTVVWKFCLRLSIGMHGGTHNSGDVTSFKAAKFALDTFHRSLPPPHCKSLMASPPRVTMKIQPRKHVAWFRNQLMWMKRPYEEFTVIPAQSWFYLISDIQSHTDDGSREAYHNHANDDEDEIIVGRISELRMQPWWRSDCRCKRGIRC